MSILLITLPALLACGGGGNKAACSILLEPTALSIPQGSSADLLVKITRQQGFTNDVTIALNHPPNGISADTLPLPAQKSQGC